MCVYVVHVRVCMVCVCVCVHGVRACVRVWYVQLSVCKCVCVYCTCMCVCVYVCCMLCMCVRAKELVCTIVKIYAVMQEFLYTYGGRAHISLLKIVFVLPELPYSSKFS